MPAYKILVTGPFNSGKTTFIKTVSDIAPVKTEKIVTEKEYIGIKEKTTVAMDFGMIAIDKKDNLVLHLYGTPGQTRFDFMWDILIDGALGIVILADSTDKKSVNAIPVYLNFYKSKGVDIPIVIGLTRADKNDSIHDIGNIAQSLPVLKINAENKEDVKKTLLTLLERFSEQSYSNAKY